MPAFALALNASAKDLLRRPAVYINGMHHARELTTLSMQTYMIVKILFNYVRGDQQTILLLESAALIFVPSINYDGYLRIGKNWDK